jgi:hypothetical protein
MVIFLELFFIVEIYEAGNFRKVDSDEPRKEPVIDLVSDKELRHNTDR